MSKLTHVPAPAPDLDLQALRDTAHAHGYTLISTIWLFAFGYFACYVPYSALTKALSEGLLDGPAIAGAALLPITGIASLVGMFVFISAMRWWSFAGRRKVLGVEIPFPGRWTFMSGLATAAVIPTTTLAYTFSGVSIVFMMLLMRGGVLVLAPLVDALSGRHVRWFSWLALGLSLGALLVAFFGGSSSSAELTVVAMIDVVVYLLAYFVRLRFMSKMAKSSDPASTKRYFVEEQMTATPALVFSLGVFALIGGGGFSDQLAYGFTEAWGHPSLIFIVLIGLFSQGTGIFGALVLLDRRENSFCVPVNRASSILAGLAASASLTLFAGLAAPGPSEFLGALLVIAAILALSLPGPLGRYLATRRAARRAAATGRGPA